MDGIGLLNWGIPAYGLEYDTTLWEMLAKAWFDAYYTETNAPATYLENSAEFFRKVIDMGMKKDYLYSNLYTIYYELGDYNRAETALQEYEKEFPKSYLPHALRGMLLITIENGKEPENRDYALAYAAYWDAKELLTSQDDQTYFQQLESLIQQLKDNGWL